MGLLDQFLVALDQKRKNAATSVRDLATDPVGLLGRWGAGTVEELGERARTGLLNADASMSVMPEVRAAANEAALPTMLNMLGTFAGVGAKTADVVKLDAAKKMVKAGADPVDVWKATGWTDQFPDGKWRFEIPDKKAIVRPSPDDYGTPRLISESVTHPAYFKAYPELRDMTGEFRKNYALEKPTGSFGFAEDYPAIEVNAGPKTFKSTTLHEMQHAVQEREGFARGGSPNSSDAYNSTHAAVKQQIEFLKETIYRYQRQAIDKSLSDAERSFAGRMADKYAGKLEQVKKLPSFSSEYDAYRALAGEAEARLTQSRMNLTPAERALRPPWLEFDVPREQQIVRGLLGQ